MKSTVVGNGVLSLSTMCGRWDTFETGFLFVMPIDLFLLNDLKGKKSGDMRKV